MPSKLTGDAILAHTSPHTYIHIYTYFLTDELKRWNLRTHIHITRRGQYIDEQRWKAPVSVRPLSSQLYLHSRVAFATLYTLHRTIICIPGANTPPTLTEGALQYTFASQHHVPPFFLSLPSNSPSSANFLLPSVRKSQARTNNGYGKTTRLSIENAPNAAINTKWRLVTTRSLLLFFLLLPSPFRLNSENWSNDALADSLLANCWENESTEWSGIYPFFILSFFSLFIFYFLFLWANGWKWRVKDAQLCARARDTVINLHVSCFNGNRLITSTRRIVCPWLFIKYDDPPEHSR